MVSDPDGGASPVTRAIIESADPRLTAATNPLEAWLEPVREAVPCRAVNLNGLRQMDPLRCPPVIREALAIHVSYGPAILGSTSTRMRWLPTRIPEDPLK